MPDAAMDSRAEARRTLITETVDRIREIEAAEGLNRGSLDKMRDALMEMAARRDLFTFEDFPLPEDGSERNNCLYRLSEDDDHRYALYANVSGPGVNSPVHDHTVWAIIVGCRGQELNRRYDAPADRSGPPTERDQVMVEEGAGVAFMPDDVHSIHIDGPELVLNFHMYGKGLEQLHGRRYHKPDTGEWVVFPAHSDIRDAR
jgi:predicted metal-dependent enzyme (double-stranded beta helix superfamily)